MPKFPAGSNMTPAPQASPALLKTVNGTLINKSILCYTTLLLSFLPLLPGCQSGKARTSRGTVISSPANAETPSTAKDSDSLMALTLPPSSLITVSSTPATPESPAVSNTTYSLPGGAVLTHKASSSEVSVAPPRAPDKSVEIFKAAAAERRYLLFIGIGLGIAAIAVKSLLPLWPGLWKGAAAGAVLALAAWKLSEIPAWIWACSVGVSALLAIGYKRSDADKHAPQDKAPS